MANNDIITRNENSLTETPEHGSSGILTIIERVALNPEADIEKLERLLDMKERIDRQEAQRAYNEAMSQMQCDLPTVAKRGVISVDGQLRSKYAKFEDINEVVKPVMKQYGFAVSFNVQQQNQGVLVKGTLMHRAGHSESTEMFLPTDNSGRKNALHALGSSISYGKRYVMSALLNITTRDEDDDGEAAAPAPRLVTAMQAKRLDTLLAACHEDVRAWFSDKYGSASDVPAIHFAAIEGNLKKRAKGE